MQVCMVAMSYTMNHQMLQDCMQIDEAMTMFQRAIDIQPNIASTYVYLGYE